MDRNYGLNRVLEPKGVVPATAWKVDNSRTLFSKEARVSLERIHLEWGNFQQICTSSGYDENKIRSKILDLVEKRGKLHNPFIGSGGVLIGTVEEIAEDLTYYFATSEQVPSAVGLGVLMNKDNTVKQAGGFIVQLMPFTEDTVISKLERNLAELSSVTTVLNEGKTPEEMLNLVLKGMDVEITDTMPARFYCNCDKKRVEKAIISIGKKEISEMISENKPIEVNCHFCNTFYNFSVEELKAVLKKCSK